MTKRPELTIGVEEEYQVVDPETRELQSIITHFREQNQVEIYGRTIASELHQSMVELGTKVCHTADEILEELRAQRKYIRDLADSRGLKVVAASTHPLSSWETQDISPYQRYQELTQEYQIVARRMLIWGMHVHIGISDKEFLIDVMNITRYFLPHILALTCSSPFWSGDTTGMKSYRISIADDFPRSGIPAVFSSYQEYLAVAQTLIRTNCIEDTSKIWWNVRPHHTYPTLEFRISDICPRLVEGVAVAALLQALVLWVWKLRSRNLTFRLYSNDLINENKWRAARHGLDGLFVNLGTHEEVPIRTAIREMLGMLTDEAVELQIGHHMEVLHRILENGCSADRQLKVFEETGDYRQVVDHLIQETETDVPMDRPYPMP